MANPHEIYFDPARQMERKEGVPAASEQIEEMKNQVDSYAKGVQMAAALAGESNFMNRVIEVDNYDVKLRLARQIIETTPFIGKLIPDHIADFNKPAFIVAFVETLNEQKQSLQ